MPRIVFSSFPAAASSKCGLRRRRCQTRCPAYTCLCFAVGFFGGDFFGAVGGFGTRPPSSFSVVDAPHRSRPCVAFDVVGAPFRSGGAAPSFVRNRVRSKRRAAKESECDEREGGGRGGGSFVDLGRIDSDGRLGTSGGFVDYADLSLARERSSGSFDGDAAATEAEESDAAGWRLRHWVVIVDDEFAIRRSVGDYVRSVGGYRVSACSDGQALLDLLDALLRGEDVGMEPPPPLLPLSKTKENKVEDGDESDATNYLFLPDCIVSDVRMPGIDGIELLGKIRSSDARLRDVPVILLTAKAMVSDRIAGYRAACDGFLPKPFRPEELLGMVDNVVRRREQIGESAGDGWGSAVAGFEEDDAAINDDDEVEGDAQFLTPTEIDELSAEVSEIKDLLSRRRDKENSVLPPKSARVLTLLARGYTNAEICITMDIFEDILRAHMTDLWEKSSTSTKTDLLRWAIKNGHVDYDTGVNGDCLKFLR